ncbi:MAG: hypothetical protein K0B07_00995 [DPANN group archaeon]|nr:hypothetical protein [DPANN group archaeon]
MKNKMKKSLEQINDIAVDAMGQNQYVLVLGNICRLIEGKTKSDALRKYISNFDFGFNIGNVFEGRIEALNKLKSFKMQTAELSSNCVEIPCE